MVLYAYMCCVCIFSLHRESPDMILGDKPLIYEEHLAHIRTIVVSLGGKLTYVLFYATTELDQRMYVVIFGVFFLVCC
jgi:hypothetical protein